jgi:hypothetical protein
MADEVKYIEVTDEQTSVGSKVGVHSVLADWKPPQSSDGQTWRWITADEAKAANPALFGITPEPDEADIAAQIEGLQEILAAAKAAQAKTAKTEK